MLVRTAAIELAREARVSPGAVRPVAAVALHPGTVDTGLSAPFKARAGERARQARVSRGMQGASPRAGGGSKRPEAPAGGPGPGLAWAGLEWTFKSHGNWLKRGPGGSVWAETLSK